MTTQDKNFYSALQTIPNVIAYHNNGATQTLIVENIEDVTVLELPARDITNISGIEKFENIEVLNLFANYNLENIDLLGSLTKIKELSVDSTSVNDISVLAGLHQLKILKIGGLWLYDIEPLKDLEELEELWIDRSAISDISPIAEFKSSLKKLRLDWTAVSDIQAISNMTSLESLYLMLLWDLEDIFPLENLVNLKQLHMSYSGVRDISVLANLKNLEYLDMSYLGLDDNDLTSIEDLTELKRLFLYNNNLTNIDTLSKLTNLECLDVSYNKVNDFSIFDEIDTKMDDIELYISDQRIECTVNNIEQEVRIELPDVFQKVILRSEEENNNIYKDSKVEFYNCTLSDDKKSIILEAENLYEGRNFIAQIDGGLLEWTTLEIDVQGEKADYWINYDEGNLGWGQPKKHDEPVIIDSPNQLNANIYIEFDAMRRYRSRK